MARAILENKIMFNMKIQNVQQLRHVYSTAFVIRGLEWKFKIEKNVASQEENQAEDTIGVWLYCNIPNEFKDFMCGAQAKIKLVSFDGSKESSHICIVSVYDSKTTNWGLSSPIEWKTLFNDGYIRDDAVLLEFELKVGLLEREDYGSLIMSTIKDKYDGVRIKEKSLKLILNKINNNFVATKSTKFKFNGLLWHSEIIKWFESDQDYFRMRLYCDNERSSNNDWSCELSIKLKLMPINKDILPIEKCTSFEFDKNKKYMSVKMIEWPKLEAQFVKNDAIEMLVDLKVK